MLLWQAIVVWGLLMSVSGLCTFIYDYQTLIGSGVALLAAYVAVRPVYEQLELSRTQANGALREMLLGRQLEVEQAHAAISERVETPIRQTFQPDHWEEQALISEHRALQDSQGLSRSYGWLKGEYHWRDSQAVEKEKDKLAEALNKLRVVLDEIHIVASMDQQMEDHDGNDQSISDEVWGAMTIRSAEAKSEVEPLRSAAERACMAMKNALQNDLHAIKNQLKKVDAALIGRP